VAAIQLVKLAGARSIAVSSSQAKLDICLKLGSFAGINYKENPDFSSLVMDLSDGKGANVILDPVMGSNFNFNLDCLAMDA